MNYNKLMKLRESQRRYVCALATSLLAVLPADCPGSNKVTVVERRFEQCAETRDEPLDDSLALFRLRPARGLRPFCPGFSAYTLEHLQGTWRETVRGFDVRIRRDPDCRLQLVFNTADSVVSTGTGQRRPLVEVVSKLLVHSTRAPLPLDSVQSLKSYNEVRLWCRAHP
jgi:hypothetical protein